MHPDDAISLADYRRQVTALYAEVRNCGPSRDTWLQWRKGRDRLFRHHSQSAIPSAARASFAGLVYYEYDPAFRFETGLEPVDGARLAVGHSGAGTTHYLPIGSVSLTALGSDQSLTVYWLEAYGGGLFLPFRDRTSGNETYGGGRYLLDTAKGADLGGGPSRLVVDFNYSYHPSCVHSSKWSCPLAPLENHVSIPITAGERLDPN